LGITEKVIFTGFYDDIQKYSLLKNSLAFLHMSLYEGFGISVVEAMRSKTPVVVHESDVYKEVVGEGGIFVDGKNEKQVGEILFKLYIAKNYTNDVAQKGYEISLLYSWENTAQITYDIFKRLCG
jgi:glycosyltransferase involved in cell wall biosynthesis